MPRIEISDLFGGQIPEGVDAEKTGELLDQRLNALLEEERSGVRSSEQKNVQERDAQIELLKAELEDLRSGTPASSTPSTETGSKAAEIRARQQAAKLEAERKAEIEAAIASRDNFWKATLDAKEKGIPDSIIERSGGNAERLADLTVMYQELSAVSKPKETQMRMGQLTPTPNDEPVGSEPANSIERVARLVAKLPSMTMSGGVVQNLDR